jgi:hypothetical protein
LFILAGELKSSLASSDPGIDPKEEELIENGYFYLGLLSKENKNNFAVKHGTAKNAAPKRDANSYVYSVISTNQRSYRVS